MYIQYLILADCVLLVSIKNRQGCRDGAPPGISSVPSGLSDSSLETPPRTGWRGIKGCRVGTTREGGRAFTRPPTGWPCHSCLVSFIFPLPLSASGPRRGRRRRLNDFLSPCQNVDVYLDERREPGVSAPSPTCCLTRIRSSFGGAHTASSIQCLPSRWRRETDSGRERERDERAQHSAMEIK